jgi:hypothetical protein
MKALPPAPSQLELLPRQGSVLFAVEPSARPEILRTLAEIFLAAASETAIRGKEARDEAE